MSADIAVCRRIYEEAFGSCPEFDNILFCEGAEYLHTDGGGKAMLFSLPCVLHDRNDIIPAMYIYACATDAGYRGRGYMRALLDRISVTYADSFLFLVPAENKLKAFYEKNGFKQADAIRKDTGDVYIESGELMVKLAAVDEDVFKMSAKYEIMYRYGKKPSGTVAFACPMDG